jgi:7-cyano-7-deazaguanine reductase
MKYGEKEINEFNPEKDLELWDNNSENRYVIKIELPEFSALCPRSGYPDYAIIKLEYIPNKFVVELKSLKLYINSFRNKYISHEDSINEIFSILNKKLQPHYLKLVAEFNPRGNVHTSIEINTDMQKIEK